MPNVADQKVCVPTSYIIRPHRLHAVHRCGLLLQMSHVAWYGCLRALVCVLGTRMSCAKLAQVIEMPFGA